MTFLFLRFGKRKVESLPGSPGSTLLLSKCFVRQTGGYPPIIVCATTTPVVVKATATKEANKTTHHFIKYPLPFFLIIPLIPINTEIRDNAIPPYKSTM